MSERRLDRFAADRWIDSLATTRLFKAILRYLLTRVDTRSGASHPRFPIFQAAIAWAIGYSLSQLNRGLAGLEGIGLVKRRPSRKRGVLGRLRQDATDYELVLPDECWRVIQPIESTAAARVAEPEPTSWTCSVRGKLSERISSVITLAKRWKLNAAKAWTFIDERPANELAPMILDAAMTSAERVDDSLRHRTIVCLDKLRQHAHDVALLACNLGLDSWAALNGVRAWVRKCLMDPARKVESAEHGMNILRIFMREQVEWVYGDKGLDRIRELARVKRESEVGMSNVAPALRQVGAADITVKFAGRDEWEAEHRARVSDDVGDDATCPDMSDGVMAPWEPDLAYEPLPHELDQVPMWDDYAHCMG